MLNDNASNLYDGNSSMISTSSTVNGNTSSSTATMIITATAGATPKKRDPVGRRFSGFGVSEASSCSFDTYKQQCQEALGGEDKPSPPTSPPPTIAAAVEKEKLSSSGTLVVPALPTPTSHPEASTPTPSIDKGVASSATTSSTVICNDKGRRPASAVRFNNVQIREYKRVVGDNPGGWDSGPKLSLGWGYIQNNPMSVNVHEQQQQVQQRLKLCYCDDCHMDERDGEEETSIIEFSTFCCPSYDNTILYGPEPLDIQTRRSILKHDFEISSSEIQKSVMNVMKVQKQRERSIRQGRVIESLEILAISVSRKIRQMWPSKLFQRKRQKITNRPV